MRSSLPLPGTPEGAVGLTAIVADPGKALIALDFDGTLSPIVAVPGDARPHPAAGPALRRLAGSIGTLAIITGRPARTALELSGFGDVPGLVVIGHHGWERWEAGTLTSPPPPAGIGPARARLERILAGAPEGTWLEDKGPALVVHTRRTAEPQRALEELTAPLAALAAESGLTSAPGRMVIELRPSGIDKGRALTALVTERHSAAVMYAGDDLGDLPAFEAVRTLRAAGHQGVTVASASGEVTALAQEADLVVDGPEGVSALLVALADALPPAPAR